jgi:hypothetical protein
VRAAEYFPMRLREREDDDDSKEGS